MVKISAQILGRVIGNSESLHPLPKGQDFHHPRNNSGARLLPESQQIHLRSLEWEVQVQNRPADPRTLLAPGPHTTMHGGVWSGQHHRPQITRQARKTRRLYEKSKVYCKLYFASLRSSFLQDLLISMIFSQMYLLTLESLCAISVSSTVSCRRTRKWRSRGEREFILLGRVNFCWQVWSMPWKEADDAGWAGSHSWMMEHERSCKSYQIIEIFVLRQWHITEEF